MLELDKIYCGDCIEGMKQIPDNSIDLVIADPPYNIGKFKNWHLEEYLNWCQIWLDECVRTLKNNGSIFVYGTHKYLCYNQVYLYQKGLNYQRQIIWHYENGMSRQEKTPVTEYEPILWFSKGNNPCYNIFRVPYKSIERIKHNIIKNGKVWKPHPNGKKGGDVWNIPTLAGKRFEKERVNHPTQKPLALCNRIIKHFCPEDSSILVPFAGSGSECISAIQNNRHFIGFEVEEDYCRIAKARLHAIVSLSDWGL